MILPLVKKSENLKFFLVFRISQKITAINYRAC